MASTHDELARAFGDRYELAREIGAGGMATVYLAHDRRHRRDVAIKVLLPELARTLGADRFLREIQLVARLQHPHILPLFDSGEADGLLYFVMPYVDGESLRGRLDRSGAFSLEAAAPVLRQLADALDYAHARGVIHRDLKPENVLLADGQALLADFGIARGAGEGTAGSATLTSVGMAVGTPTYMSPEQATGEREIDARSDVYSLACVCYEMLAGRPPFTGPNAMALISQHIVSEPEPLVGARGELPPVVVEAVARALAKDPSHRPASAGELAMAVEQGVVAARQPSPADSRLRAVERAHEARQRVLVLEFANVARAADADWLSVGIAETLSADLGKIAGVKVIKQDAAARRGMGDLVKDHVLDTEAATAIGRSVGAHWVVWGAFQKAGPRIRITPRFADIGAGTSIDGEKIDGSMEDVFTLQDRIVTDLAKLLRIPLSSSETAHIRQPETADLGAYEHYARGYRAYLQFGTESVRVAAEHFRSAIAIDDGYALAHAGLGIIHGPTYIATGKRDVLDEGARLLERAIALDPSIGEAYAWLAYMRFRQHRFDEAIATARRGLEHDPASDMGWYMLGSCHLCRAVVAHEPEGLARSVGPLLRAMALNPRHLPAHMVLASLYIIRGQYSHAVPLLERSLELERNGAVLNFVGALTQRATLHLGAGELDAASPLLDEAIRSYTGADHVYAETVTAYSHFLRGCLFERRGMLDEALADFQRACAIAESNEHRITIGAHWVKGRFGIARVMHRLGRPVDAARALAEGRELFTTRARYVWTWFIGAVDAEVLYELASTYALMERADDAAHVLRRAGDAGWADVTWLRHDPSFAALRDTPELRRVATAAASRVTLPPPVGSGGMDV